MMVGISYFSLMKDIDAGKLMLKKILERSE